MHLARNAVRAVGGPDSSDTTGFHFEEVGPRRGQKSGSAPHRIGEERDEGRLPSRIRTAESAEPTTRTAADGVAGDDVPVDPLTVPQSETAPAKNIVRRIDVALRGRNAQAVGNLAEHFVELMGRDVGHPSHLGPLGSSLGSWRKAGHPVDRGAPAHRFAGQEGDARVRGRHDPSPEEQSVVGVSFRTWIGEIGEPSPGFQHDHMVTCFRDPGGDHTSARPATDDADIGLELAVRFRDPRAESHQGFGDPRGRRRWSVVDPIPERVAAVPQRLGEVESCRESFRGLETSSLHCDPARGPPTKVLLAFSRAES